MAGKATSPEEISRRQACLVDLESKGITSRAKLLELIRQAGFECSKRTLERDLAILDEEYRKTLIGEALDRHKRRQVDRAVSRYRELEAEWQRSKQDKERRRTKAKQKGDTKDSQGRPVADEIETEESTEGRLADVACQREMRENDAHICKVLGLYSAGKHEHGGNVEVTYKVYGFDPNINPTASGQ